MSLIQFRQDSEGKYIVFCPQCHKQVMIAPMSEIAELVKNQVVPLCFDCVPLEVDKIPSHIMSALDVYLIGFGDATFLAAWFESPLSEPVELRCRQVSPGDDFEDLLRSMGDVSPLSSSTYLHNLLNIRGGRNE